MLLERHWIPRCLLLLGLTNCSGDPAAKAADDDNGATTASTGSGTPTAGSSTTTSASTAGFTATMGIVSVTSTSSTDGGVTTGVGGANATTVGADGTATAGDATETTTGGASVDGNTGGGAGGTSTSGETATTSGGGSAGAPTFSRPEGTVPNATQPDSAVDIPLSSWPDGLISPTLLDGHQINQPQVFNGYLVVAGNEEFWIFDVSDPTAPEELSSFSTPGRTGAEAESHTVSFARYGDTYYMVTIGGKGIDTWDVTDARAPEHVGKLAVPGTNYGDYTEAVWGVAWQGQYIYVGATNNGVKVVDATDPRNLSIVGELPTSQFGGVSAGPVEAVGNVLVVMTPKESAGIATLDITDPTEPKRLASFTSPTISYIGMFYRHWAFLISPLRVWDVLSDPRNIGSGSSPLAQLDHGGAEYMSFSDNYLFLGHVRTEIGGTPGASKIKLADSGSMQLESNVWGRQDRDGLNDDQFSIPFGNLLVLGDDQAPYAGWVIAAHDTEPDSTPPVVDTVIPEDQSTVATSSRIGISFTDNIELATVNSASFIVRPVGGQPLSGKYGLRMGVVNFDPDEDLEPGTEYEVVLPAGGIADYVGNTLSTEWKSTFTTN